MRPRFPIPSPRSKALLTLGAIAALGAPGFAQARTAVIQEGNQVLGFGPINKVNKITVANNGLLATEILLDIPSKLMDGMILRDRFASLQEGSGIPDIPGATIKNWIDIGLNNNGDMVQMLNLNKTPLGMPDDSGLFWNLELLLQESNVVMDPARFDLAGWIYFKFKAAELNDSDDVAAYVDLQPPSGGLGQPALIYLTTDGSGNKLTEKVLMVKGDPFPGNPATTITTISGTDGSIALNNNGDWLANAQNNGPTGNGNGKQWAVIVNGEVVARDKDPAPFGTRTYEDLSSVEADINDLGEYVFNGKLNDLGSKASDAFIQKNDQPFVQEGETFPAIAPHTIEQFGSAALRIDNGGNVVWFAELRGPAANEDEAIFRNRDIVIHEGVTIVNGSLITALKKDNRALDLSTNGRFLSAFVITNQIGDTVVMVDFGSVTKLPGCTGNPSTLEVSEGLIIAGANLEFEMDNAQEDGALPFLLFSTRPSIIGSPCGVNSPYGEIMIGTKGGQVVATVIGTPWLSSTPSIAPVTLPNDLSLVDAVFYSQGYFFDSTPPPGAPKIQLTNGLRLEIGAP